jgi:proteic killer suppression protein
VIKSFKHKGLEAFFYNGDRRGIIPQHSARLGRILDRLDASAGPRDMNLPGFRLHELKGKDKGTWAVWVSGNRRVTFQFEGNDVFVVDYRDYH